MPVPSPFHPRTGPLCTSYSWKDWAGYHAVCRYDHSNEHEYFAFREAAGVIDVTPLFKYDITGPDAAALLSRVTVRDIGKLSIGRVVYCCWCDDDGKIVDDGTVTRLAEDHYRLTAADPTYHWLARLGRRMNAEIRDTSTEIAALALQGPTSRDILQQCTDSDLGALEFFGAMPARMDGLDAWITRTGYTGDLGFEIWVSSDDAIRLWDLLADAGQAYGLEPAGLDALDLTRVEAGFIMLGVDYFSAPKVVLESRKSTPYELGLGWTVQLDRGPFVGQASLRREKEQGSVWQFVGLELDWPDLERLYDAYGLPPHLPAGADRTPLPVFSGARQIGQATSHAWSPIMKKPFALASVKSRFATLGTRLEIEHTVEFSRHKVSATVVPTPFFNPQRKRNP